MYYNGMLGCEPKTHSHMSRLLCSLYAFLILDIPDDEAQYWTGKLERINTMEIDDEVKGN